jgi:hypothetical protein
MRTDNHIQYLNRSQINDDLWNECISKASNGLIYGYTYYLDNMADNWDALIFNNYEAVMPLPWRKKWTIFYLYQPFLTAQLGVFGNNISSEAFASFLHAIPKKFRYWDLSFNHQNLFSVPTFPLHQRSNFVLSLHQPYENLYKAYRENIKRNIKKSKQYGCTVATGVAIDNIIELTKFQAKETLEKDYQAFKNLFHFLKEKGAAKTYGIVSNNGGLLASCVFFFSHNRAYYILVGNHPNGRTLGASHTLIDGFIQDHAGQELLLDFEGSDIRNLAFFYSSFGAVEEKYAAIKLNRLPRLIKYLTQTIFGKA